MKKQKIRTRYALASRITALTLSLWLVAIGLLTWAVASDMSIQMEQELSTMVEQCGWRATDLDDNRPGLLEVEMIDWFGYPYLFLQLKQLLPIIHEHHLKNHISSNEWLWGKWDLFYGFEAAMIFYDADQNIMVQTGDHLTFSYTEEAEWKNLNTEAQGYGYIALEEIKGGPEAFENSLMDHPHGVFIDTFLPLLRCTGYFEENQFWPVSIERGCYLDRNGWVCDIDRLCWVDTRGLIEWETILTTEYDTIQPMETIYAWDVGGYACTPKQVTVNGTTFNSLVELLHADLNAENSLQTNNLWDSVLIRRRNHEDNYGPFMLAVAVRYKPLQYAMIRLVPVYLVSFVLVGVILWRTLRTIRIHLTKPLEELRSAVESGTTVIPSSLWLEPYALQVFLDETRKTIAQNHTDLQQLRTSLDYAHHAEEHRKQLISNITHELKTPLAIIHSYTECLQENIAEEKRGQYLEVIMEETKCMDALVLQMLDLSRLEAGKVRLASDSFSLLQLAKSVMETFTPILEEKELVVQFGFEEDFFMTADESRIRQVITNLWSNAVKYTPKGGIIRVKVYLHRSKAHFTMENTTEHLSEEALEKVWDSFYRADPSRSEPGTGLGLTLVKSIVQLHGGTCSVRNTVSLEGNQSMNGVEFSFILPLG